MILGWERFSFGFVWPFQKLSRIQHDTTTITTSFTKKSHVKIVLPNVNLGRQTSWRAGTCTCTCSVSARAHVNVGMSQNLPASNGAHLAPHNGLSLRFTPHNTCFASFASRQSKKLLALAIPLARASAGVPSSKVWKPQQNYSCPKWSNAALYG